MAKDLDQYHIANPKADFDAIDLIGTTPQEGQVDPIMSYTFELNDEKREDVVQSTTFYCAKLIVS